MRWLRRMFFRLFPCYRTLEIRSVTYREADDLIDKGWVLAREEDVNPSVGFFVILERRERIWE